MRNMPIPRSVSPMVGSTQPLAHAATRRVLMNRGRDPAAIQRLNAAITDHRARMRADAELARQACQP